MSRALEDLHATHPDWQLDVRTTCNQLFKHNPCITQLKDGAADVEIISPNYDGINQSNQRHVTYCEAWAEDLSKKLGEQLKWTGYGPKLYISPKEAERPDDLPKNYWVLNAGYKDDCMNKRYPYWPEMVELWLQDDILKHVALLQIGHSAKQHNHKHIPGCINFIGKGDHDQRILLRQTYHADGVLTTLSGPGLYAQALNKPVIIVAGGREPPQWQQMTMNTRMLHTVGQLPCCSPFACWKSHNKDCKAFNTTTGVQKCMELIKPSDIIIEARRFYEGGQLVIQE